ncbi:helix-turn-helix domain-containing protein [Streptomyces sp. NPDC005236]|uniref:helix-turn-helix domain-containing protein n=1 Tax=Streptomyces sp. NPDC005236 TaxID=3157028 RepID=UPI00339FFF5D
MGRPEKALLQGSSSPCLVDFARGLRAQRTTAGLTYTEMAGSTSVSAATLKRAASGTSVPHIETVRQFYAACRPYLPREQQIPIWKTTLKAWQIARMEERGTLGARGVRLTLIADARDLSLALQEFWEKKGALSVRAIRRYSGTEILLPLTSLERILKREALPQSKAQLLAIVRGCFATLMEEKQWDAAWQKVFGPRRPPKGPDVSETRTARPGPALFVSRH